MIIGGGIAGTSAALALHKAGIAATVYEAHPDSGEDIGAFLILGDNGMRALEQLDAAETVAAVGFPLDSLRLVGPDGTTLAEMPLGSERHRYRCLRRAELGAVLREEVRRRGVPIVQGKRLAGATEEPDGVVAHFAGGDTARGDLLIGADGLNSVVRPLIDPEVPARRYAGQQVFYGYTLDADPPHAPGRIDMIRGGAAFGYAVSPAGETFWFARVTDDELTDEHLFAGGPDQWRDRLISLLHQDDTPAADIVAATGARLMATNAHDLPSVPRWSSARMLIIGDAAHAASPASGQGASMAIEDAVVLGKALRDLDRASALAGYERLRRPRVETNIANSARLSATPTNQRPGPAPGSVDERDVAAETERDIADQIDWDTPVG
ncbi:2-polyprenyl-6-methoxyphenol hydroxylase-like FAD-dependent oxidoreductase [Herbihabitans rhizosphaerae]|uniref:2-polyprenyl-6-methoxyphenol hydroxylase-like FAD-dependent oxidoreductase n=1 Tax=Herbihabitans rhizosphaerae TaxID=1872711 RepID=A0A4Q7L5G7_9PSEU|nr:2-polyprenyl-6-methoxyphenol hydroxylase-like FAD-dependent oxidoreductase [Herbihabitans rhizosphaerae]